MRTGEKCDGAAVMREWRRVEARRFVSPPVRGQREKEAFTRRREGAFAVAEVQGSRWDERGEVSFLI